MTRDVQANKLLDLTLPGRSHVSLQDPGPDSSHCDLRLTVALCTDVAAGLVIDSLTIFTY